MMYNVLTVLNEEYLPFARLFLGSFCDSVNLSQINRILVYETGINDNTASYLRTFPKVDIVNTGLQGNSKEVHDEGWQITTMSKTKFLHDSVQETKMPTIMIDIDCIFVKNFLEIIDSPADVVVCSRNTEGFSKHIGSFFVANNVDTSTYFLRKWISNIHASAGKHKESPALSITIEATSNLRIQNLDESVVSSLSPSENVYIYHLKSGSGLETISKRIGQLHVLPYHQKYR